jgi:hypothetical protein
MSGKNARQPGRLTLAFMCIWVACASAFLLYVETVAGFFLFFSPGWANGPWFSFQTVLSVGLTGYSLLMLMTAVAGIGAFAGLVCTLFGIGWERAGRDRRIWFWSLIGFLLLVAGVYGYWYAVVCQAFPDGYVIT